MQEISIKTIEIIREVLKRRIKINSMILNSPRTIEINNYRRKSISDDLSSAENALRKITDDYIQEISYSLCVLNIKDIAIIFRELERERKQIEIQYDILATSGNNSVFGASVGKEVVEWREKYRDALADTYKKEKDLFEAWKELVEVNAVFEIPKNYE